MTTVVWHVLLRLCVNNALSSNITHTAAILFITCLSRAHAPFLVCSSSVFSVNALMFTPDKVAAMCCGLTWICLVQHPRRPLPALCSSLFIPLFFASFTFNMSGTWNLPKCHLNEYVYREFFPDQVVNLGANRFEIWGTVTVAWCQAFWGKSQKCMSRPGNKNKTDTNCRLSGEKSSFCFVFLFVLFTCLSCATVPAPPSFLLVVSSTLTTLKRSSSLCSWPALTHGSHNPGIR